MSEWTDMKPHVASEEFCAGKYGVMRHTQKAHCSLCGHVFVPGDGYRWVYMNGASPSPGNFFVCSKCDRDGLGEAVRAAMLGLKPHMEPWVMAYHNTAIRAENERLRGVLKKAVETLMTVERVAPGYDWNADHLYLTRMTGEVYQLPDVKQALAGGGDVQPN